MSKQVHAHAHQCRICGSTGTNHDPGTHVLQIASAPGDRLAFIVEIHGQPHNTGSVARTLARARGELYNYFPDKSFSPFIPQRMVQREEKGDDEILRGEVLVTCYIVTEE